MHYLQDALETVSQVTAAGGVATQLQADLSSNDDAAALFSEIDNEGPPVNQVVNNPAIQPVKALRAISASDWRQVFAANLDSAF